MLIRFIDSHFDDQTERGAEPEEVRLIDANRMKIVLEKNFGGTGGAAVLAQLIDMQPTAYDTDRVLNELVVLHDLVNMNQKLAVSQAIDIVKRGGQE